MLLRIPWFDLILSFKTFLLLCHFNSSMKNYSSSNNMTLKNSHNIKVAYFLLTSGFCLIKLCIFNTSPPFLSSNTWQSHPLV